MLRKLLFLLIPCTVFSQLSSVKNYYHDEGLYCKAVYNLGQDKDGIIWIGTDNGLYSFDGKTFVLHDGSLQLKDTEILGNISLDDEIFVVPLNKNFAYLKDGKFITKKENSALGKIKINGTINIIHDSISKKNVISSNHLSNYIYTYKKGVVEEVILKDSCRVIKYHDDVVYLFNATNEVFTLDIESRVYTKIQNVYIPTEQVQNIFFGDNSAAFILKDEVYIYKIRNNSSLVFDHKLAVSKTVRRVHFNANDNLWLVYAGGGITHYDIHFRQKTEIFNKLIINNFFVDKNQNVWFSTKNRGLFFWSKFKFKIFLKNRISSTGDKNILSINGFKDTIYYGLNVLKAGVINPVEQKEFVLENSDEIEGIISIHVSKDRMFFATKDNIYVYTNQLRIIKKIPGFGSLKKLSDFDKNTIIVSASGASYLLDKETLEINEFFTKRSYAAVPIDEENAFICSSLGLFKVNVRTHEYTPLISDYNFLSGSKASNTCYGFATNAGGIFIVNDDDIQQLTKKNGLLGNSISKVIFETPYVLWAIGNRGVNRIVFDTDYKAYKIASFTQADGIPLATINDFYLHKEFMYLATSKGLEVLNIDDLLHQKEKEKNTKLVLNHIRYRDTTFYTTNIKIPYSKNSIRVNVSYPDYNSYGNTTLKYKLANQENYTTTKASDIILSSLQPGKHELQIYGLNSSNISSEKQLIIVIDIIPMFWQTWWFKILLLTLLITLIYTIIFRIYISRKKRKQEKIQIEKKLTELEVEVIKSQMNPHFISNCLNAIKLLNYKKDYSNSQLYIDRFNRMLRFNLAYSNNTFVTIKEEVTYLKDYLELEKLRFKELFEYKISALDSKMATHKIPSFLIQPFVENAIKHAFVETATQQGNIRITFNALDEETIEISIEDDGVGIGNLSKLDRKKESKGIALIRKRIELYRQIFNIFIKLSITDLEEGTQKGTKIQLKITNKHAI